MNTYSKIKKMMLMLTLLMISNITGWTAAIEPTPASQPSTLSADTLMRWVLVGVIVLFVLIIAVLAGAIKLAGGNYIQKILKNKDSKIIAIISLLSLASSSAIAQTTQEASKINSFSNWDVYLFITVIILLFVVVLTLVKTLFILMGIKKIEQAQKADGSSKVVTWFQKFNETVPIEDEASLDMSHDYDGIRELDNKIPSWWTWTFISTILFGIIYLYRMFGTETLPNQFEELAQANLIAAEEKTAYLKKGANNVDENTVKLLSAAEMGDAASLYAKNCIACHGDKGQGGVGPNLTDDYWIHKGGIKDIFYSLKYGWAEKGMKSWKEDFSPMQIAQLSSYVKTLHGTNPPGGKEKQGELYTEDATAPADSSQATPAADTSAIKK